MGDWDWVAPVAGGVMKGINSFDTSNKANSQIQQAYDDALANLRARFGDYDAIGSAGYQDLNPVLLGKSAMEGIPEDLQARQAQQEALARLAELANNGGLSLADMKTLNDIQANLSRNNSARNQGLANQFAARGQLGAGAQLGMALQGQSDAAMRANDAGESAAAQAQARALEAILAKGKMAGSMSDADYRRKSDAARAHDIIEARNAAARTDASKYNNSLRGQGFEDKLALARGKTSLTNSMNEALFGKGTANANTTKANGETTNRLIDNGVSAFGSRGGGGGGGTQGNTATDDTFETDEDLQDQEDTEAGGDD